jgi:hypothetical protein
MHAPIFDTADRIKLWEVPMNATSDPRTLLATWPRMFLEPVEQTSGDIDAAVKRDEGDTSAHSAVRS